LNPTVGTHENPIEYKTVEVSAIFNPSIFVLRYSLKFLHILIFLKAHSLLQFIYSQIQSKM